MFDFRNQFEDAARPARAMFETWISFFPTAPLFGVKWRFGPDGDWPANGLMPFAMGEFGKSSVPSKEAAEAKSAAKAEAKPKPSSKAKSEPTFEKAASEAPELMEGTGSVVAPVAPVSAALSPTESVIRIQGIGPGLAKQLSALGIETLGQMAELSPEKLNEIDNALTSFKGRCHRDDWIGQAKTLIGA